MFCSILCPFILLAKECFPPFLVVQTFLEVFVLGFPPTFCSRFCIQNVSLSHDRKEPQTVAVRIDPWALELWQQNLDEERLSSSCMICSRPVEHGNK